jgi:hypothetical protein
MGSLWESSQASSQVDLSKDLILPSTNLRSLKMLQIQVEAKEISSF